jgi:hypothetical protein
VESSSLVMSRPAVQRRREEAGPPVDRLAMRSTAGFDLRAWPLKSRSTGFPLANAEAKRAGFLEKPLTGPAGRIAVVGHQRPVSAVILPDFTAAFSAW